MAFTNQFSLSLELTKFIPVGPILNSAGRGLAGLVRELQVSGSDIVTEQDLAGVFGRNRIEQLFASTFRTAVKQSLIHKVSDLAELVIEAGAGPTVRRSLNEPAYFSTVVQLSLLSWTQSLTQLAKSLSIALERRAQGSTEYVDLPSYDALKGTLRACREQTSGFMWELFFSAVDEQLTGVFGSLERHERRPVPTAILQALLDSFTAVQHLPEHTLLRIRTVHGVSTVIIWAHHVLGLTVAVQTNQSIIRFGPGTETVYIDCRSHIKSHSSIIEASLMSETNDLLFRVVESKEDDDTSLLVPTGRYPLLGYGNKILELEVYEAELWEAFVYEIVTSCISLVQKEFEIQTSINVTRKGKDICPSAYQVLEVGKMLFPKNLTLLDSLDLRIKQPCLVGSKQIPEAYQLQGMLPRQILLRLTHVLLVLSMIDNITSCQGLSLDYRLTAIRKQRYDPFHLPDAREAFYSVASLIRGSMHNPEDVFDHRTAVISAWGWSLCMGSILCHDPSELKSGLAVYQGVPTRKGERKRLILDSFVSYPLAHHAEQNHSRIEHCNDYTTIANPGDRFEFMSWTRPSETRYFISTTDIAFEVAKFYRCEPAETSDLRAVSGSRSLPEEIRLGFRSMQELYWEATHITNCEHLAYLGREITLCQDTWAFNGFGEPKRPSQRSAGGNWTLSPEGSVHVGLVAGNTSARWILLSSMLQSWRRYDTLSTLKVFVRGPDCCFDCAINISSRARTGKHVGLVL